MRELLLFLKSKTALVIALILATIASISPFYFFESNTENESKKIVAPIKDSSKAKEVLHNTVKEEESNDKTNLKEESSAQDKVSTQKLNSTNSTNSDKSAISAEKANSVKSTNSLASTQQAHQPQKEPQANKANSASANSSANSTNSTYNQNPETKSKDSVQNTKKTADKPNSTSLDSSSKAKDNQVKSKIDTVANTDSKLTTTNDATNLQVKVDQLVQSKTEAQKEAYIQSLKDREEQVNAAVASIAQNSRMYLPPMLSDRALVVYFSVPVKESIKNKSSKTNHQDSTNSTTTAKANANPKFNQEVDILTGATVSSNKKVIDGVKYIAEKISALSGAKTYNIATAITYPQDVTKLYDFAFDELSNYNYPELIDDNPLDLNQYDTIYLCYPNWWRNMPAALYSFVNKYDLSSKTIIPICLHAKDGYSKTISTIAKEEPHSSIYKKGMLIQQSEFLDQEKLDERINTWLMQLSEDFL